jgi:hypothetical protein
MDSTAKIVMIPTDIEITEFIERVAAKFDVSRRKLKCSFRDEDGQMMDLSDQDEMEMLIELAKEDAKLNKREFGRAEVRIPAKPLFFQGSKRLILGFLFCISSVRLLRTAFLGGLGVNFVFCWAAYRVGEVYT